MFHKSIGSGFLRQRIQRSSEGFHLTARQLHRGAKRFGSFLTLRYVAQDDGENYFVAQLQLGNGGLSRKFTPIFSPSKHFTPFGHRARNLRGAGKLFNMLLVSSTKSLGHQKFERFSYHLSRSVSKCLFSSLVEQKDALFGVNR